MGVRPRGGQAEPRGAGGSSAVARPRRPAIPERGDLARGRGGHYSLQCSQRTSGPSGHDADDSDGSRYESWSTVPVEDLRSYAAAFIAKVTIRTAARVFGLKREGLRKFANGEIKDPRLSTRRAIGEVLIRDQRASRGQVREARSEVPLPTPDEFRAIFGDRDRAHRWFAELFARVPPDEAGEEPVEAEVAHDYVKRLVNAAFAAEPVTYATRSRPSTGGRGGGTRANKAGEVPAHGDGGARKKRPAAKKKPRREKDDADGGAK